MYLKLCICVLRHNICCAKLTGFTRVPFWSITPPQKRLLETGRKLGTIGKKSSLAKLWLRLAKSCRRGGMDLPEAVILAQSRGQGMIK